MNGELPYHEPMRLLTIVEAPGRESRNSSHGTMSFSTIIIMNGFIWSCSILRTETGTDINRTGNGLVLRRKGSNTWNNLFIGEGRNRKGALGWAV